MVTTTCESETTKHKIVLNSTVWLYLLGPKLLNLSVIIYSLHIEPREWLGKQNNMKNGLQRNKPHAFKNSLQRSINIKTHTYYG